MKNFILIIAAFIILFLIFAGIKSQEESNDVGRYQLISGNYFEMKFDSLSQESGFIVERQSIFKIDTKTGNTWIYVEQIINKEMIIERLWLNIKN